MNTDTARIRYGFPNDGKPSRPKALKDLIKLTKDNPSAYLVDYSNNLSSYTRRSVWHNTARRLGIKVNTHLTQAQPDRVFVIIRRK